MTTDTLLYTFAILIQVGILVFFLRKAKKKKNTSTAQNQPQLHPDTYHGKRQLALEVTPSQLGLSVQPAVTKVHGLVIDWDMNGTVLTLTAYITGAANAFLSSGSFLTGAGNNPAVAENAAMLVQMAQNYLGRCMPVNDTGLPLPGTVRFYLLTNKGIFAAQEMMAAIENDMSPWGDLFYRANGMLEEIKKTVE
jgi:hypothetical protein